MMENVKMTGLKQFKKSIKEYLEIIPLNKCVVCGKDIPVFNKVFCTEFCKELMMVMIFKKLTEFEDWRSSDGDKRIKL